MEVEAKPGVASVCAMSKSFTFAWAETLHLLEIAYWTDVYKRQLERTRTSMSFDTRT